MKNFLKLSILAFAFTLFAFVPKNEKIKVVIDVSHGGDDFGATFHTAVEKDIVASIAQKIKNLNHNKEVEIYFTREEDKMIPLKERVNFVETIHPDLVISLHSNANKKENLSGIECYISDKETTYEKSNTLAEQLITQLSKKTNLKNLGVKKASFSLLKNTKVPSILIELGYLSNENDRTYIENKDNQIEVAQTIFNFISSIKK